MSYLHRQKAEWTRLCTLVVMHTRLDGHTTVQPLVVAAYNALDPRALVDRHRSHPERRRSWPTGRTDARAP